MNSTFCRRKSRRCSWTAFRRTPLRGWRSHPRRSLCTCSCIASARMTALGFARLFWSLFEKSGILNFYGSLATSSAYFPNSFSQISGTIQDVRITFSNIWRTMLTRKPPDILCISIFEYSLTSKCTSLPNCQSSGMFAWLCNKSMMVTSPSLFASYLFRLNSKTSA